MRKGKEVQVHRKYAMHWGMVRKRGRVGGCVEEHESPGLFLYCGNELLIYIYIYNIPHLYDITTVVLSAPALTLCRNRQLH